MWSTWPHPFGKAYHYGQGWFGLLQVSCSILFLEPAKCGTMGVSCWHPVVHQICRIALHCNLFRSLQLCWEARVSVSKRKPKLGFTFNQNAYGEWEHRPAFLYEIRGALPIPRIVISGCNYLPISPNHNLSQRDETKSLKYFDIRTTHKIDFLGQF